MIRPPRLAQRILNIRLAHDERDELIGDLDEQFMRRAAAGVASARRWYWGQTLALDADAPRVANRSRASFASGLKSQEAPCVRE